MVLPYHTLLEVSFIFEFIYYFLHSPCILGSRRKEGTVPIYIKFSNSSEKKEKRKRNLWFLLFPLSLIILSLSSSLSFSSHLSLSLASSIFFILAYFNASSSCSRSKFSQLLFPILSFTWFQPLYCGHAEAFRLLVCILQIQPIVFGFWFTHLKMNSSNAWKVTPLMVWLSVQRGVS